MRINTFRFHQTLDLNKYDYKDESKLSRLYLLNQATEIGQDETAEPKVGIPHEFWEGEVVKIYYEAENGGHIDSYCHEISDELKDFADCQQYVVYGYDAVSVKAIAKEGYEFIGWSDGVMEAERTDLNVTKDMYIIARFKKIEE